MASIDLVHGAAHSSLQSVAGLSASLVAQAKGVEEPGDQHGHEIK